MINSAGNDDIYSSTRISDTINDLYRNAGARYQKPALFFEKIDELLLTSAHTIRGTYLSNHVYETIGEIISLK